MKIKVEVPTETIAEILKEHPEIGFDNFSISCHILVEKREIVHTGGKPGTPGFVRVRDEIIIPYLEIDTESIKSQYDSKNK